MAKLLFYDDDHRYELDGVILPSVTHICRYLSVDIADGARPWLRDAAADRGSRVHAYCAAIDLDIDDGLYDADCVGYVAAYKAFLRDYRPKWELVECPIASARLGVAGTLDRYGIIDGKRTLADLKTGSSVEKAQMLAQLSGYHGILIQPDCTYPSPAVESYLTIKLRKDGTYTPYFFQPDFYPFMLLHKTDMLRRDINATKQCVNHVASGRDGNSI